MGGITSRPVTSKEKWKPHETLQFCFEQLQDLLCGEMKASYKDGRFVFEKNGILGTGEDICSALIDLKINLENSVSPA